MLKGKQKKLDKNKDGKISGEDFKMMKAKSGKMAKKPGGAVLGAVALGVAGALGGKKLLSKKKATASVAPGAKAASVATPIRSELLQKAMDDALLKKAKSGKMMKAKSGKMMKASAGAAALLGVGGAKLQAKLKDHLKEKLSVLSPAMQYLGDTAKNSTKKVAGGAAIKGMGAARTQGEGLQDENLIPGKSLDYYKDIM